MREYNPFLDLKEVRQSGLLNDFFPDDEGVAVANNKNGFIPLEEVPDNEHPDPLERLILKEEGEIIEDELEDETDNSYAFYEPTEEDLKPFHEI